MIFDYLKISVLMMRSKPVRSMLSLLGIYIGVMALLIILAIREGIRRQIDDIYQTKGAHVILVMPGFDQVSRQIGRLSLDDVARVKALHGVLSAFPRGSTDMDARSASASMRAHVVGIDAGFVPLYRIPLLRGRNFFKDEVAKKQPVCLVTTDASKKLFPSSEALGAFLDVNGSPCTVVGIVDWTSSVSQRTSVMEADILMPISFWKFDDDQIIGQMEVRMTNDLSVDTAKSSLIDCLTHRDPSRKSLFFVRSLEEMMEKSREMSDRILVGLLGIAAISLLVGGIGIANVMVTSVTERTREIGIRKRSEPRAPISCLSSSLSPRSCAAAAGCSRR